MQKVKTIIWGLGAMGQGMAEMILNKDGMEIVGVIASRPEKDGKDLGELLGIKNGSGIVVSTNEDEVLKIPADVVLLATSSFAHETSSKILKIIKSRKNVITIAEEMVYPSVAAPELTKEIDAIAKEYNVSILGTGINPGFVLDTLLITLSGICMDVRKIIAKRVNDLSPFGTTVMQTQGVGTSVEDFEKGIAEGVIVGHIGFAQSISMISDALGLGIDEIREIKEPIISTTHRETASITVEPGRVAGCRHIAYGLREGEVIIEMEHPQQIRPEIEGVTTGDYINILGNPDINVVIKPELPGGIGTIAIAVNMIPQVINADPGVVTMKDLPVPVAINGDIRRLIKAGAER